MSGLTRFHCIRTHTLGTKVSGLTRFHCIRTHTLGTKVSGLTRFHYIRTHTLGTKVSGLTRFHCIRTHTLGTKVSGLTRFYCIRTHTLGTKVSGLSRFHHQMCNPCLMSLPDVFVTHDFILLPMEVTFLITCRIVDISVKNYVLQVANLAGFSIFWNPRFCLGSIRSSFL